MNKRALDLLKRHEGKRNELYKCPAGKWTIGYGHNLEDNPLSDAAIEFILLEDMKMAESELDRVFPDWRELSEKRQAVLIDMMHNLGAPSYLTFHKFWKALLEKDYEKAANEMLDSRWATQVGERAQTLSSLMRYGNS